MINIIMVLVITVATLFSLSFCDTFFEYAVVFALGVLISLVYCIMFAIIRIEDRVRQKGNLSYEDRLLKQETALKLQRERLDWERAERERESKIQQKELEIFK